MRRVLVIYSVATLLIMFAMLAGSQRTLAASSQGKPTADGEIKSVAVKIDNFTFTPATVTVPVGTQVTWTNHDDIPHNVVNDDQTIKSKVLDTDEKFTFTFTKPGTYAYFCSLHPKMTGKVVVQ
jgi:plastocyanin